MPFSNTDRLIRLGMPPELANELANQIAASTSANPAVAALTPNTVTATTGSLPTPGGSTTIANAATPTVVELLDFCVETRAKVADIMTALKA